MAGPAIELPRVPSAPSGAIGLDDGAPQLRLFLRVLIPVALGFAVAEALLGLVYRDPSALIGAIGLTCFAVWAFAWCLPQVGRMTADRKSVV